MLGRFPKSKSVLGEKGSIRHVGTRMGAQDSRHGTLVRVSPAVIGIYKHIYCLGYCLPASEVRIPVPSWERKRWSVSTSHDWVPEWQRPLTGLFPLHGETLGSRVGRQAIPSRPVGLVPKLVRAVEYAFAPRPRSAWEDKARVSKRLVCPRLVCLPSLADRILTPLDISAVHLV